MLRVLFSFIAIGILLLSSTVVGGGVQVAPEVAGQSSVIESFPSGKPRFGPSKDCWIAARPVNVKISKKDWNDGAVVLSIFPFVLENKILVKGGDISKKRLSTLIIELKKDGSVSANHYSWHNKQKWLKGVSSAVGTIRPMQWNRIVYKWGKNGQRLVVNGKLAGVEREQNKNPSWVFEVVFQPFSGFYANCRLVPVQAAADNNSLPDLNVFFKGNVAKLFKVAVESESLFSKYQQLTKKYGPMPYERARLAIIRYFSSKLLLWSLDAKAQSNPDVYQPEKQDLAWVIEEFSKLKLCLDKIENSAFVPLCSSKIIPRKDMLSYKKGAFFQDGRPVYIIGTQDGFSLNRDIGFAICGWTFGPRWELPRSDKLNSSGQAHYNKAMQAYKQGQFWDELYSAHSKPGWLLKNHRELNVGCGFMTYDITSPISWDMNERTLKSCLPSLSKVPNFAFFDLMNEPAFNGKTVNSRKEWQKWLKRTHGSIKNLNKAWEASYKSWDEIKVPGFVNTKVCSPWGQKFPKAGDDRTKKRFFDWTCFNNSRVNDWFRKINNLCKTLSPGTFTYTKMISSIPSNMTMGIDPVQNVRLTDLNGSDAWWVYQGSDRNLVGSSDKMSGAEKVKSGFSVGWNSLFNYDFLRSANPNAPIVNSEDHLFAGGFTPLGPKRKKVPPGHWDMPIPWEHYYAGQWQQCIHGKGMSIIWTHWPRHNLDDRATAVYGASKAALDLNRLSRQVFAISSQPADIYLLYSFSSLIWDKQPKGRKSKDYLKQVFEVYSALSLNGVNVRFVLEEDLIAGKLPDCKVIISVAAKQINPQALVTLKQTASKGIELWGIGKGQLAHDSYNRSILRNAVPRFDKYIKASEFSSDSHGFMRKLLRDKGLLPEVMVCADGKPADKIEWRIAEMNGHILVNMCNYGTQTVKVSLKGKQVKHVTDLIEMKTLEKLSFPLAPEQVKLLELR